MPKIGINANILTAMKLDLKVLTEISSEISSWCEDSLSADSWKHSKKHVEFYFPEFGLNDNKCGLENYLQEAYYFLLENTHESFYGFLSSIVQLMNMMPPVVKVLSSSTKTYIERKPTLATLSRMLWYRLEIMYKHSLNPNELFSEPVTAALVNPGNLQETNNVKDMEEGFLKLHDCKTGSLNQVNFQTFLITTNKSLCSSSTQTNILSLVMCESCDLSVIAIRCIIDALAKLGEKYKQNSHVGKLRNKMRDEVYNVTQLGAMNKWIMAICKDINKISDYVYFTVKKQKNLNYEIDLKELENAEQHRTISELKERIVLLNNDINIYNKKLEIEKVRNLRYSERIEDLQLILQEKDKKYRNLKQEQLKLDGKVSILKQKLKSLQDEKITLNEIMEQNKQCIQRLESEKDHNVSEYKKITLKVITLKENLKVQKIDLEQINSMRKVLQKEMETYKTILLNEISFMKEKFDELQEVLKVKEKDDKKAVNDLKNTIKKFNEELRMYKHRESVLLQRLDQGVIPKLKLSHDPLKDMAAQYEVNEIRISSLCKENEKLLTTIRKYKNHKKLTAKV